MANTTRPNGRASTAGDSSRPARESRLNRIAVRAHELYQARGGAHGRAIDDWLQAEREIDAADDAERGATG